MLISNNEHKSYATVTYMYDKVKEDVITNGYGSTYTGEHADTTDSSGNSIVGTKPIYYYQTEGHNNVHFGNFCWQIVRTTDTGGVKLIYNGVYSTSSKCNITGYFEGEGTSTTLTIASGNTYYYGTSYTFNSSTGKYSLSGTKTSYNYSSTNKVNKYTCKSTSSSGTCSTLYYINSKKSGTTWNVTTFTSIQNSHSIGKSKFNTTSTNSKYVGYKYKGQTDNDTNSTIKAFIDNWYSSNMTSYKSYLEDIVFCDDRTGSTDSSSAATGTTWNGDGTNYFYYHNSGTEYNKLSCDNVKDRFTTNNVSAKLEYPIGLISVPEFKLLDDTSQTANFNWWLLSPSYYEYDNATVNVNEAGYFGGALVDTDIYVRPTLSLNSFNTYKSGNGSISDPYELGDLVPIRDNSYLYDTVAQDVTELGWGDEYTDEHADTVEDDGAAIVGDEKIYYYTASNHNNVKLGDFCWQIIRTTDTGGVKLVYNGTYSSDTKCDNSGTGRQIGKSVFNNGSSNSRYVGYKFVVTNYNDTDSTIKAYIDNWYSSNMTSLESYLEDTVFCNDRTGSTDYSSAATGTTWDGDSSYSSFYYHNYDYKYNKLFCDNEKDRFSTNNSVAQLSHPIGLMSQPEYLLGGSTNSSNVHYTGSSYWLVSPREGISANVRRVNDDGSLSSNNTDNAHGVRPSVSLKPDIKYSEGTGTTDDPYIVDSVVPKPKKVTYNAGTGGTLSGTATEEVESGGHPTGRDITPNNGYNFVGWVANKKVTLSNNDTITKGTLMTKEQTQSIVVNSSITLTAKYYKGWLYDQVKTDATTNSYGGEYTDEHADTVEDDGTAIVGNKNIYYYTVANHNNVKFGDFCWQIVRTTDTGGIKLLYNGTYSSDTKCNNSGTGRQIGTIAFNDSYIDTIHVGYKYKTTNYNDTDSTIKTYIDNWYSSNLSSYESYLEDTVFCNDRTGSTSSSSAATGTTWYGDISTTWKYFHNFGLSNYNKLSCDNVKDRFSVSNNVAQFSYPIGLITSPESQLLDSITKNTSKEWWLLSPYNSVNNYDRGMIVYSDGSFNGATVNYNYGVRPSISLAPNITFEDGSGTTDDPYIVGEIVNPEITATFYYQSSTTSGTQTIASKTETCTPSNGSCEVTIPSEVKNSVGKYNNSYAGLSTNVGTMSTNGGASKNDTSVTITGDTTLYATYSSSVTNYYYE